ncbi:MAG: GNAT family N-acetyltransferase [Alphaproteobacteria bacterium]|nr:MAG: GNAT family N-acetyltransferase [Alphaproteobacteria bacterium]
MRSHPLDCPIWSALTSRQSAFGTEGALARRFAEDISPFAAAADDSPDAVAALAGLAHADDDMSLLERAPPSPPPGILLKLNAAGVQMVLATLTPGADIAFHHLGDADAPDMLALATLTRPGPFRARTHKLGRFIGVRDNGQLIAMAGERLQTDQFVEVSGICTHPDHRGRGLAAALTRIIAARILEEGKTPFLHAYASNTGAISVYRKLGFEHRCDVTHAMWTRA